MILALWYQTTKAVSYTHLDVYKRQFLHTVGVPPKHLMNLIRYQCLWQQMLRAGRLDYPDAVAAYGYADQSHLIADFKKYHSLTPTAALERWRTGGR